MPKSSNHIALSRQWEILRLLPSRMPGITARELTQRLAGNGFAVAKRTVERDLRDLSRIFRICSNEISIPFGWYWDANGTTTFPGMEVGEALSLALAEDHLRALIPSTITAALEPRFKQAREKMNDLASHPFAHWQRKVRFLRDGPPLIPPKVPEAILRPIQEALAGERVLRAVYRSMTDMKSRQLDLNLLALVVKGTLTYLVATVVDHGDVRLFAAHRFEEAKVTSQAAVSPPDFDLDAYLKKGSMRFGLGKQIRLCAIVREPLVSYLAETPIGEDQKLTPINQTGEWKLRATVQESWELRFWIQSQGRSITIEKPKPLAKEMVAEMEAALLTYKSATSAAPVG